MMQYSLDQRKAVNNYYRENSLDIDNFDSDSFADFHIYSLDGIDGVNTFHCTPIERNIFCQIRSTPFKFMPEYQVGKYYCDFANPEIGIAIEADGKQHEDNTDYDLERDQYIESRGLKVYRFKGKDTFKDHEEFFDYDGNFIDEMAEEYATSSAKFINSLSKTYKPSRNGSHRMRSLFEILAATEINTNKRGI